MNNYKFVKISSRWTDFSYVGLFILIPVLILIAIPTLIYSAGEISWILFGLGMFILAGLGVLALLYLAKVEIIENQFHIKKLFKPKQIFDINLLTDVKVYPMRKEDYIIFTITENGKSEKVLVYANKFFLYANENRQTEKVLREILNENKK